MGKILLHSSSGIITTCDPSVQVLRGAAILVEDDKIAEIGKSPDLLARCKDDPAGVELVDCSGRWILPGDFQFPC